MRHMKMKFNNNIIVDCDKNGICWLPAGKRIVVKQRYDGWSNDCKCVLAVKLKNNEYIFSGEFDSLPEEKIWQNKKIRAYHSAQFISDIESWLRLDTKFERYTDRLYAQSNGKPIGFPIEYGDLYLYEKEIKDLEKNFWCDFKFTPEKVCAYHTYLKDGGNPWDYFSMENEYVEVHNLYTKGKYEDIFYEKMKEKILNKYDDDTYNQYYLNHIDRRTNTFIALFEDEVIREIKEQILAKRVSAFERMTEIYSSKIDKV